MTSDFLPKPLRPLSDTLEAAGFEVVARQSTAPGRENITSMSVLQKAGPRQAAGLPPVTLFTLFAELHPTKGWSKRIAFVSSGTFNGEEDTDIGQLTAVLDAIRPYL